MTHDLILATIPIDLQSLVQALLGTAAFGLLGIVLMIAGFKLFEVITRKLDIEKQLDNQNMAVGIVVGSLLLGISLIVVVSMM
jgi:putative membrane protein